MKRYNTVDVTDLAFIEKAVDYAAKGKKQRKDVAVVLASKDWHIRVLRYLIVSRRYKPSKAQRIDMIDPASGKRRLIYCPKFFPDQCFHHIMIMAAVPVLMKGMSPHIFASVPNRGAHYGKKFVRRWLDTDRKNTKYCMKLDIKKFYPSIPHDKLIKKLHRKFKDKTLLWMFEITINSHSDSAGRGIAIGFYPSQWLSNFYLQDFDHFVKERLYIVYYGRYMDDMVMFGCNKKELHKKLRVIFEFLENEGLRVKENWQIFRVDYIRRSDGKRCGRDVDFMGFRFYRDKTTMRRRNALKIRRAVSKARKADRISVHRAAGILSYLGWVEHTDSWYFYNRYVGAVISVTALKVIVSRNQRRLNRARKNSERKWRYMRTRSGVRPQPYKIERLSNGNCNVILATNIAQRTVKEADGEEFTEFEYDAYRMTVPYSETLEERVRENYGLWLESCESEYKASVRAQKKKELRAACQKAIYDGVDVETSEGREHFSLDLYDQQNLQSIRSALGAGATQYPYHADGKECVMYSAWDLDAIVGAAARHITYHTTYCNMLVTWIGRENDCETIKSISYGDKLPDDLAEHMQALLVGNGE